MNQVASRIDTLSVEIRSRRADGESRYGAAGVVDMRLSGDPRRVRTDMAREEIAKLIISRAQVLIDLVEDDDDDAV